MGEISLKGILAGVVVAIILAIPESYLSGYYFAEIYNDVMPNKNLLIEENIATAQKEMFSHPLFIIYIVISVIITIGIPAYVTAWVSNKGFVLNAFLFSIILLIPFAFIYGMIFTYPLIFIALILFTIFVAIFSGYIRMVQVRNEAV